MGRWGCRWLAQGLAAALLLFASPGAAQSKSPAAQALDDNFARPNSPETFRALTGRGDPRIEPEGVYAYYRPVPDDSPEGRLLARLFPDGEASYGLDLGECRTDYALETLKARIAALGADHAYVRRWVEAQRAVFAVCRRSALGKDADLPPPAQIADPAVARLQAQDRAYQAAALRFYRDDRKAALAAFRQIATSASPHRLAAGYMVAAIRAGSRPGYRDYAPLVPVEDSLAELRAILADPAAKPFHPQAQQLLGWIGATVADLPTRQAQVQATLAALEAPADVLAGDPEARRRYALARADIDNLHRWSPRDPSWWLGDGPPPEFTASRSMMEAARTDPLAAWVLFPVSYVHGRAWAAFDQQGWSPANWGPLLDYARERRNEPDGLGFAWTRAERALARDYDPEVWGEVRAEAAAAAQGDPRQTAALAFDFYHQVRLALSAFPQADPERDAAFEAVLSQMQAFPLKDADTYATVRHDGLQYLMAAGRLGEARRWRDALYATAANAPKPRFDDFTLLQILAEDEGHFVAALAAPGQDAALPLQNNLSIASLRRLAQRPDTPAPLKAKFSRIAWGRTYALGRTVDGDLDRLMRELNPAMVAGWSSRPGRSVRPSDRRALLDVLRSPAVNILIVDTDRDSEPSGPDDEQPGLTKIDLYNHDDDNWWCRWKPGRNHRDTETMLRWAFFGSADLETAEADAVYGLRDRLEPLLRASYAFRSRDLAESEALAAVPCAPKVLTERTIEWVTRPRLFETRDGQAEALALAVKTTRYGCYSDGPHGAYSKAAFRLLHTRFADSEWARRTKYWFDCPLGGKTCPAVTD